MSSDTIFKILVTWSHIRSEVPEAAAARYLQKHTAGYLGLPILSAVFFFFFLLKLIFDPEDGGDILLRKFGLSPLYTVLQAIRPYFPFIHIFFKTAWQGEVITNNETNCFGSCRVVFSWCSPRDVPVCKESELDLRIEDFMQEPISVSLIIACCHSQTFTFNHVTPPSSNLS
jgi:hypothetical protein